MYLQQKFKDDPMWVFSSFFYCVSLFVIKPRINLNLLLFHLSIPQLSCYGQIIILIYKLRFALEGPSQLKGTTFIPFQVQPMHFMAKTLIPLEMTTVLFFSTNKLIKALVKIYILNSYIKSTFICAI